MSRSRILVLGGGFGGVYAARQLERLKRAGAPIEVTLVSRDNFFLFTPMLHEVAASDLDITHIVSPLRTLLHQTSVFVGEVEAVDLTRRRVLVSHGLETHSHELHYDQLVLALGSTTNFYHLPGLETLALTMKTLGDAIHLRNRVIATLEEADTECASGTEGLLTFVVAGGGFAGVETLGALNDFVRQALRFYPRLDTRSVRMVLVHAGGEILPELGEKLGAYAHRKLVERGLEVITSGRVTSVTPDGVHLADGTFIPARLVVWTAGTSPHPLLARLPCETDRGRVIVDATMAVPGWRGVWALGDCAVIPDRRTGMPFPPTAQHAIREAKTLAGNIIAELRGVAPKPFRFQTIGQLAAIGRRSGVARVFGLNFSGFVAWWLWRTIYLSKLPRLEKKVRVALDWTLDLLFSKDFVQFLTVRGPVTSSGENEHSDLAARQTTIMTRSA
ncbi:MAG TPA: NAD(P)/FAD-dependent oxidoreductase [Vicinamibacterales bacterium]|nr:NAD(P)/FAD-dependent oxidoreductase [Vicinamibacterales bacterium]